GEAARLHGKGYRLLNVRVFSGILAVLLIGGKARKAEHRQGNIAIAFGRQEVAVVNSAEPRQQFKPHRAVSLELGDLAQRNLITQITGNHPKASGEVLNRTERRRS